jgi:hypothetical protein
MCKYFAALKLRGRVSFNDDVYLIRSLASNNGDSLAWSCCDWTDIVRRRSKPARTEQLRRASSFSRNEGRALKKAA